MAILTTLLLPCVSIAQSALYLLQPTYLCPSGFITFNTIGGDGTTITYSTTGVALSSPNSNTGVVEEAWRTNPNSGPVIIQATQSNVTVSYTFDILTYCSPSQAFLLPILRRSIPDLTLTAGVASPLLNIGSYFRSNNIGYDYRALFRYRAYGIPPGMVFNTREGTPPGTVGGDTATAYLSGVPTVVGVHAVSVIATSIGAFTAPYSIADTFNITVVAAPMPVTLTSFTAKPQQDQTVELKWSTSSEINNLYFLIERSKDLSLFEKVGEVKDLGLVSQRAKTYSLKDETPYTGTSYYRLTQTDLSGKATVYPVISIVLGDAVYGVGPNPIANNTQFTLRLDEPETAILTLYGIDGRVLPLQKMGIKPDKLLLKLVGGFSAGVYILTVDERGQTRRHRLVVE